ncbi:MAG: DEAD/DEAH box helicase [Clostridium sp.]|uniref:DEAD/DEAH box helicase n=1 Tax=Clostridium sp. TaxID=1506 RepID=UPI003F2A628C
MVKDNFMKDFLKNINVKERDSARKIVNNELIEKCDYKILEGRKILFQGKILSSDLYSSYKSELIIDILTSKVEKTSCTCEKFMNNKKDGYCCSHIISMYLKKIEILKEDILIKKILSDQKDIMKILFKKEDRESKLLQTLISASEKKLVCIDVYINKNVWTKKIGFEFKIGEVGNRKRYIIKDIKSFLLNYNNRIPMEFSNDFIFSLRDYNLVEEAEMIITMMNSMLELEDSNYNFRKRQDTFLNKKEMIIPEGLLKTFLLGLKKSKIFLNSGFFSREIETEILECDIEVPIELYEIEEKIKMNFPRELPEILGGNKNLFLYDTTIYSPSKKQRDILVRYIENLGNESEVSFDIEKKETVFKELIPSLQDMTSVLVLDNNISEQLVFEKPKFKFYFNRDEYIKLIIKVVYGEYEFNIFRDIKEKYIYRDKKLEQFVINKVINLKFGNVNNDLFVFIGSEDNAFEFFNEKIDELHEIGEIYYSEDFKGKLNISKGDFNIQVQRGREEYFEFKYAIKNIPDDEFKNILMSFRENKKYHKLNSGEYIDLEDINLKELLKLLDSVSNEYTDESIKFNLNKSVYMYEKLNSIVSNYGGKSELAKTKKKILENEEFKLPLNISATLRAYQVEGYNFFKRLSGLGMGGILGDEMGLGKTLQAITFITSEKGKKTLIVAPTSLVYNWEGEFSKFSPNMKVLVNTDSKEKRKKMLENIDEFDVVVTSYNLLKNDIDVYKTLKFDFMILDEAQYIKNPGARITRACKEIKANSKFALTGTPIENSLLELWSIFDFIMEGYLFDKKTFNSKYNRNLSEEEVLIKDLKKLTTPFILRRLKRDVLDELPEKIEKIVYVDMTKEQKKVYSAYIKYINELIDKKVSLNEFKKESIEILAYITKLRQIALHPTLVTDNFLGSSGKINALKEIVTDTVQEGHKILIFSQFTSALKIVEEALKKNEITSYYIDGSVKGEKRVDLVNRFNEDDTNVFLISLKAGGTGLNLTSADVVVHLDPWWNPAVESQATDRAHRIGQKNAVEVIKLIAKGTIEEKIISLQEKKKEITNAILDGNEENNNVFNKLTAEEILSLLKEKF